MHFQTYTCLQVLWCLSLAVIVRFDSSTYDIDEGTGPLQPVLLLSGPSAFDITVEVINDDITAIGMFISVHFDL